MEDKRINAGIRIYCKYGARCYQKNPEHLIKFKHPHLEGSSNGDHGVKRRSPIPSDGRNKKLNTSEPEEVVVETDNDVSFLLEDNEMKTTGVSYDDAKKLIKELFLFTMPDDFYRLYDFCIRLNPDDPMNALQAVNLQLVGPYDVLNGTITAETIKSDDLLCHWRYYYDPPEFQTILKGNDKEGLHFGYWRDRPSSDPVFVATNSSEVSHKVKPIAETIFGAIVEYIDIRLKKTNPFEKLKLVKLSTKLKVYAKKYDIDLDVLTPKMKSREKNVVARTIHGAGIVCPYNKKTQVGYRDLIVSDNELLKIIKKINDILSDYKRDEANTQLEEVIRLATIAGDECDFGTCLELGHDLWSSGCTRVQNHALSMMKIAYSQLDRPEFLRILEAHMKNRKKGSNLSILSKVESN